MKTRLLLEVVSTACLLSAPKVEAQSIGIFFDPDGATCSTLQLPNTSGTLWILAVLNGSASGGITAAEFRMTGFPAGWTISETPSAQATIVLGSPWLDGSKIIFPTCQTGTNGIVLLHRIDYTATSLVGPTYLTITGHAAPGNRFFNCPVATLCDFTNFTKLCMRGSQGILNGPPCTVSTAVTMWSKVKGLYH